MTPELLGDVLPLFLLPALVWLTYWDILKGSWVSDDILGMAVYDGKLQRPLTWGNGLKWFRYHAAKIPNPNRNWKTEQQPPFLPSAHAHHRLNLWVFSGISVLTYTFLQALLPQPLAFLTTLLWVVHPLGVQTVGWISGLGYLVATFFMLLGLNVGFLLQEAGWFTTPMGVLGCLVLYGLCQLMAVEAMFCTIGVVAVTAWLGWWPMTVVAGFLAMYQGFHTFREALDLRRKVFHEQKMAQSTYFYPRKFLVVLKTLYYDLKLAVFPKRLGLYHTFCYHYDLPYVEQEDRYALLGGLGGLGLLAGILWGTIPIQLGSLWFLAFSLIFLNWITANQFVVDRYVWLPSLGICLMVTSLLPLWAVGILIGLALMRTWTHLPTYDSEEKFYLSNIWNFSTSEVAHGNLGVTYLGSGWIGSAIDVWWRGIQLNPEYDVCWYNLSSMLRARGPLNPNYAPRFYQGLPKEVLDLALQRDPTRSHLHLARYCLYRAVTAKTCHFPQPWQQELVQLDQELARPVGVSALPARLISPLLTAALT